MWRLPLFFLCMLSEKKKKSLDIFYIAHYVYCPPFYFSVLIMFVWIYPLYSALTDFTMERKQKVVSVARTLCVITDSKPVSDDTKWQQVLNLLLTVECLLHREWVSEWRSDKVHVYLKLWLDLTLDTNTFGNKLQLSTD